MDLALIRQVIACEIQLARIFAQMEQRPWGVLLHRQDRPDHHDANCARLIHTTDPESDIDEVVAFYRGRGIAPRARIDALTQPPDLVQRLQARGFQAETGEVRIMVWDGALPVEAPLPPGADIARAGAADIDAVTLIRREANGWTGDWAGGQTADLMRHPGIHYYVARVDGEPAACACAIRLGGMVMVDHAATRPRFQRRGLMGTIVRSIQSDCGPPLVLTVVDGGAERVYARAGFQVRAAAAETSCWLEPC